MSDPEKPPVDEGVEEIAADEEDAGPDDEMGAPQFTGDMAAQFLQNPEFLAAIQGRLGQMIGSPSGYIQSLPKVVKRRLKSLKKLQFEMLQIESKFYEEVHELECKYAAQYAPLSERRRDIVSGTLEPTDSDCDWPSDAEEDDELATKSSPKKRRLEEDELKQKAKIVELTPEGEEKTDDGEKEEENPSGIPGFWLTIFKNVDMLSDMVQEHDEAILQHLNDIKVKFTPMDSGPMGFTLEFHFEPNEFFNNSVLTKHYIMRSEPNREDLSSFEGPEIIKCTGCTIDWKKGKNVTIKQIKKKQKHKGRGTTRMVTKTVQNDSFFNFFNPPQVPEGDGEEEEGDEDTEALLAADFEIGHFIRERVVPRAVLYFTGEALEEDEFEDEGEEEGEAEEGEEDEDADPDYQPPQEKS
ncbi:nucleosome assembly protein 1-like 1 isoform X2 [Lingula anatina]|uniref:Nucleosome assembly protein 1-like 1 isoform X2 n=1 Tax=Lingula anatina TaxID=7574 RepID=A0A1S3JVF1_LINAN|nr:nucleosome assembly protein 1-like 1 isoform X2 [Lingula anatina]|eukprot:XP_013414380.1 nucleosome assembly protein 1-like 1 isoform X2 [Lingula anatina]